jgi:hypothetical protein
MVLTVIESGDVNGIHLVYDGQEWWALVNVVVDLRFSQPWLWRVPSSGLQPTIRRNTASIFRVLLSLWYFARSILRPERWGNIFLRNVRWLSADAAALYPIKRERIFWIANWLFHGINSCENVACFNEFMAGWLMGFELDNFIYWQLLLHHS